MSYKNIYFVLVRPQLGENIGATARAIKNFNFSKFTIKIMYFSHNLTYEL